tara:strand:+ start:642 stop:758 length:117 start_codon:yes stop_codon:yes gene_type:complete
MGLIKKIMNWLRCIRTETSELIEDLEDLNNYENKNYEK